MSSIRSRWAAIGAAVAVSAGAGGIGFVQASGAGTSSAVTPIVPCRLVDTRVSTNVGPRSSPLGASDTMTVSAVGAASACKSIPAGATAIQVNLISVGATASATYLTAYPADVGSKPMVSTLNASNSRNVSSNSAVITLSDNGQFKLFNKAGSTNVIIDVFGVMTPSASGAAGPKGDTGAAGLAGAAGTDGLDGADGAPGINGVDGAPGLDGATGPAGSDGVDGADGADWSGRF